MKETIELDLKEFPRESLYYILQESCIKDISVNKVIENCLVKFLRDIEANSNQLVFDF